MGCTSSSLKTVAPAVLDSDSTVIFDDISLKTISIIIDTADPNCKSITEFEEASKKSLKSKKNHTEANKSYTNNGRREVSSTEHLMFMPNTILENNDFTEDEPAIYSLKSTSVYNKDDSIVRNNAANPLLSDDFHNEEIVVSDSEENHLVEVF